jgi:hypothetical protein
MSEKSWVCDLKASLDSALESCTAYAEGWSVHVDQGKPLAYANEIFRYHKEALPTSYPRKYQTDLLVYDWHDNGDWIPRVVLECKMGLNTHDAITYSTKAFSHKYVHPYLRYGLLIGDYDTGLPLRAIRHGAYFDFMMYWASPEATTSEMDALVRVLCEEIEASRKLEGLLAKGEAKSDTKVWMFRRQLSIAEIGN